MVKLPRLVTWLLRFIAIGYVTMLVVLPLGALVHETFADGLDALRSVFDDPDVVSALQLTALVAVISVAINLVFGVTVSILLVRYDFPGKRALSALVDLPLAVSPVVVGLSLLLVYNARDGWLGVPLDQAGIEIMFSTPALVMATCFVALPLMIREVVPVLTEIGNDQEQASKSLGANSRQTFWRITLPSIRWAVIYGVVLTLARAVGEFGAVKVVSGNITGETQTATLAVEAKYQGFAQPTAYAIAFLLVLVSIACLIVVSVLRHRDERKEA